MRDGYLWVSEKPGWGVEVGERAAARYPVFRCGRAWRQKRPQTGVGAMCACPMERSSNNSRRALVEKDLNGSSTGTRSQSRFISDSVLDPPLRIDAEPEHRSEEA